LGTSQVLVPKSPGNRGDLSAADRVGGERRFPLNHAVSDDL
jgi:hypothetical protein